MSSFVKYQYTDCPVEAQQMTTVNCAELVATLGQLAGQGLLANLNMTHNATTNTYDCTYRYSSVSRDTTLTASKWLVKNPSGEYIVLTDAEFQELYTPISEQKI